ncbi:MAG: hypothetical protein ACI9Z9_002412, partial [Litorivivens sp.]
MWFQSVVTSHAVEATRLNRSDQTSCSPLMTPSGRLRTYWLNFKQLLDEVR